MMYFPLHASADYDSLHHCAYDQLALSQPPSFRRNTDALWDFVHVSKNNWLEVLTLTMERY